MRAWLGTLGPGGAGPPAAGVQVGVCCTRKRGHQVGVRTRLSWARPDSGWGEEGRATEQSEHWDGEASGGQARLPLGVWVTRCDPGAWQVGVGAGPLSTWGTGWGSAVPRREVRRQPLRLGGFALSDDGALTEFRVFTQVKQFLILFFRFSKIIP